MLATNHQKGNFPQGQFPGIYCQGAIIFGVMVRQQSSRGQLSGGQFSSGAIDRGEIIRGAIIQRAIFREAIFIRGNCPDTLMFYLCQRYIQNPVGHPEAATGGVLSEKVFLDISQNSHENTCVRVSFLMKIRRLRLS